MLCGDGGLGDSRHFQFAGNTQAEETRSVPSRAGDGPRNGRETGIGCILPNEAIRHDGDGVSFALVFTDEDSAGLETAVQFAGLLAAR